MQFQQINTNYPHAKKSAVTKQCHILIANHVQTGNNRFVILHGIGEYLDNLPCYLWHFQPYVMRRAIEKKFLGFHNCI